MTPEDIECEEFYDLMQAYRHAPLNDPSAVCAAYEAVKKHIYDLNNNNMLSSALEFAREKKEMGVKAQKL